jgi:hypothetical protein
MGEVGDTSTLTGGLTPFQFEPFGALLVWICFLAIAAVVVFIFVAIWLYRDAQSRGMSGALWVVILLIASFFFSFLGGVVVLVIYLVVRTGHPMYGAPAGYGYGYGPYAAYAPPYPPPPAPPAPPAAAAPPPSPAPTTCRSCGAPLMPNAAFCSNCGSKV